MKTESTQSLEMAWLIHSVANNWHAGERHRNTQLTSKVKCRLSSPITQVCRAITATARQHSHKGIRNMPGHAAGRARPNSSRKTARFRSPTLRWLRLRSTVNAPARIELPNHRGLTVGLILKRCRTGALDTHWSRLPLRRAGAAIASFPVTFCHANCRQQKRRMSAGARDLGRAVCGLCGDGAVCGLRRDGASLVLLRGRSGIGGRRGQSGFRARDWVSSRAEASAGGTAEHSGPPGSGDLH